MASEASTRLLDDIKDSYHVPAALLQELKQRNALPSWFEENSNPQNEWLAAFHKHLTEQWPDQLRSASAGLLFRGNHIAASTWDDSGIGSAIVMPAATPAYLCRLWEIIDRSLIPPESPEPNEYMLQTNVSLDDAGLQLGETVGMWIDTGYMDCSTEVWKPVVAAGARFLYYHELAHLVYEFEEGKAKLNPAPKWLQSTEPELRIELLADRLALVYLVIEEMNTPQLKSTALAGASLAMSLMAIREFATASNIEARSIRNSENRMASLLGWSSFFVEKGMLEDLDFNPARVIWGTSCQLLQKIGNIPSPTWNLLNKIARRNRNRWLEASTSIVKWCAFGDRNRVIISLQKAVNNIPPSRLYPIKELLCFIRDDTENLEPMLGLRKTIELILQI